MIIKQAMLLLLLAVVVGIGVNAISPNGVPLVGEYRDISSGDGPVIPPSAEPGDPPFIDINRAFLDYTTKTAMFVDARDPSEFICATIPGAVNMPFDYLPEGDLTPYVDSVLGGVELAKPLIVFCSGEECDLSLHLGRNLQDLGYTGVGIFFGGAREWETASLDMQRGVGCEN